MMRMKITGVGVQPSHSGVMLSRRLRKMKTVIFGWLTTRQIKFTNSRGDLGRQRECAVPLFPLVKKSPETFAQFTYNGDGQRVKSIINSETTYFVNEYYEKKGSEITKYQ